MMDIPSILARFEAVAKKLETDGKAFGKQSTIKNGDKPCEAGEESLGLRYSAGSYAVTAKAIRDEIKSITKQHQ